MPHLYVLDPGEKTPRPVDDVLVWGEQSETMDRIVEQTRIADLHFVLISTVFLGIDHNWWKGPPILFETMVFGGELDDYQERYPTWEAAEVGHAQIKRRALRAWRRRPAHWIACGFGLLLVSAFWDTCAGLRQLGG